MNHRSFSCKWRERLRLFAGCHRPRYVSYMTDNIYYIIYFDWFFLRRLKGSFSYWLFIHNWNRMEMAIRYIFILGNQEGTLLGYRILLQNSSHDDVIKRKHFPRYWPFVRWIHRPPVNSPHKGQWRGAFMFSMICAWINGWVYNGEDCDLRRHRAHYVVTVM